MWRKRSISIGGPSSSELSLSSVFMGVVIGVFIAFYFCELAQYSSKEVSEDQQDLRSSTDQEIRTSEVSSNKASGLNHIKRRLESLSAELSVAMQRVSVLEELSGLHELSKILDEGEFHIAELSHTIDHPNIQTLQNLCLRSLSFLTGKSSRSAKSSQALKRAVKPGDLVISQGTLLGEISSVKGECFELIPTSSELSSFEVRLEQSGIRGVAVGLGKANTSRAEASQSPSLIKHREASMQIKYLERSVPAVLGERALLVRHRHRANREEGSTLLNEGLYLKSRFPMLIIGEVVDAGIDENGLFQSALLATPLDPSRLDFVLIFTPTI